MGKMKNLHIDKMNNAPKTSPDELLHLDKESQIEIMREWFHENYEDPAESTPHITSEGGYQYFFGGPYDAEDVLTDGFDGRVPESVIKELADELTQENYHWAGRHEFDESDYDRFIINSIIENTEYHNNFEVGITYIEKLLKSNIDPSVKQKFLHLLYVNTITAMETYLSDAFIMTVQSNEQYIQTVVETAGTFKEQKIPVSAIFGKMKQIRSLVTIHLTRILWHDLKRVRQLYSDVLDIELPENLKDLELPVMNRHHLVHRNGKTIEGVAITISEQDVTDLISIVKELVNEIDKQLPQQVGDTDEDPDML